MGWFYPTKQQKSWSSLIVLVTQESTSTQIVSLSIVIETWSVIKSTICLRLIEIVMLLVPNLRDLYSVDSVFHQFMKRVVVCLSIVVSDLSLDFTHRDRWNEICTTKERWLSNKNRNWSVISIRLKCSSTNEKCILIRPIDERSYILSIIWNPSTL